MTSVALTVQHSAAGCRPVSAARPSRLAPVRSLTSTVPREYVHRRAVSEVFLTDWRSSGAGSWTVTAQWPRTHGFYGPVQGLHDPMMLVETVRQASIMLCHVGHDVPLGHPAIWQRLHYEVSPEALTVSDSPAEVELRVTDHDIVRRGTRLSGMRQLFSVLRDGRELATVEGNLSIHTPAVYQRLRGEYADLAVANSRKLAPPEPVAPALVGRDRTADVVLAPAAGRTAEGRATERWAAEQGAADGTRLWQLRVDTAHPVLFDHPVDHAPGMLMVEAARQAGHAAAGPGAVPFEMECAFIRYAELDTPCWIRATGPRRDARGRLQVSVTAEQNDQPVFTATLRCRG